MRFSSNGYYIEKYVKCATCGMLIYSAGVAGRRNGRDATFCSPWCVEWAERKDAVYQSMAAHCPAKAADRDGGALEPERTTARWIW